MEPVLLQAIDTNITQWLVQQAPVVVLMGVCVWWLARKYEKSENDKSELAKEVIKLTQTYEAKFDSEKEKDQEIRRLLTEIRDHVKSWQR
jgi:hypothetical protein